MRKHVILKILFNSNSLQPYEGHTLPTSAMIICLVQANGMQVYWTQNHFISKQISKEQVSLHNLYMKLLGELLIYNSIYKVIYIDLFIGETQFQNNPALHAYLEMLIMLLSKCDPGNVVTSMSLIASVSAISMVQVLLCKCLM